MSVTYRVLSRCSAIGADRGNQDRRTAAVKARRGVAEGPFLPFPVVSAVFEHEMDNICNSLAARTSDRSPLARGENKTARGGGGGDVCRAIRVIARSTSPGRPSLSLRPTDSRRSRFSASPRRGGLRGNGSTMEFARPPLLAVSRFREARATPRFCGRDVRAAGRCHFEPSSVGALQARAN